MSKVNKRGPTSPSMNMTPMIDVTFQLIIFFMLVNNIVAEESVNITVPKLFEPQTKEMGDTQRITINVLPDWVDPKNPFVANQKQRERAEEDDALRTDGNAFRVRVGIKDYTYEELDKLTEDLVERKAKNEEVEILLRVDAATFYKNVQPVIAAITAAEIQNVNLVAFMPDAGPRNLDPR